MCWRHKLSGPGYVSIKWKHLHTPSLWHFRYIVAVFVGHGSPDSRKFISDNDRVNHTVCMQSVDCKSAAKRCSSQVLACDTESSSRTGWDSSRYMFSESNDDEGSDYHRFVALDIRGGVAGEEQGWGAAAQGIPGWALGTGSDNGGALGLREPVKLSR